jgi:hypothetical protein
MPNKIPQTLVKLSQQLALVGYHQVDDTANPFDPKDGLSIFNTIASFKPIGSTNRFRVNQARENYQRRGINSSIEPFITAPGKVTTTIEMDRVVLNIEDAMQAFMFMPGNIAFQTRPLVIVETTIPALGDNNLPVVRVPDDMPNDAFGLLNTTIGIAQTLADLAKSPVYTGCFLANSSIEYRMQGAQAVIQNVTLNVSRSSPAAAVVAPQIEQTLLTNFPIVTRGLDIAKSITNRARSLL